jgi:hypothetical protein
VVDVLSVLFLLVVAGPALDKLFLRSPSDRECASEPLPEE